MGLIAELRERKLVQWALAYAAAAFALLQGVDMVAQRFGWPASVSRALIIASVIGFFVTLLLAWYHGERGTQKVSGTELLLLALLLAIGGGLMWQFAPGPDGSDGADASKPVPAPSVAADSHSIAVLPFVNMSGDKDNEYFSDGISEEILNALAQVAELKVAARTSSFSFRGRAEEVPEIAKALDVRMVLEGSVRKQGERVRITAQLIDASTGYHVWSQAYDRDLKDIFAIQDEIAAAIANELKVRLDDTHKGPTTDPVTYDLYLKGVSLWQQRKEEKLFAAVDVLEQATQRDPQFAQAVGALALVYAVMPAYTNRLTTTELFAHMLDAAQRTLALDPLSPEAFAAMGNVAGYQGRHQTATALLRRAAELRPSWATAHQWLGTELIVTGHLEEGMAESKRAAELDPRSAIIAANYADSLNVAGRYREAIEACQEALVYAPESEYCPYDMGLAALALGDYTEAQHYYQMTAERVGTGAELVQALFEALSETGPDHSRRQAFARRLVALPLRSGLDVTSGNLFVDIDILNILQALGEPEMALEYAERASEDPVELSVAMVYPTQDPIRCDPRFRAVVAKLNVVDARAADLCEGKP